MAILTKPVYPTSVSRLLFCKDTQKSSHLTPAVAGGVRAFDGMELSSVIILMIVAGALGGLVNYGLARTESSTVRDIGWSILIGLGASLLVPLFLNTISSTLLTGLLEGTGSKADPFVFFGFCLLGAIASRSLIQTLSQKILRTAEEAKSEVENLRNEVDPVVAKETEPEEELATVGPTVRAFGLTGEEAPQVIKALGNSKYSRRTMSGVVKESNVSKEKALEVLNWLQKNGLAYSSGSPKYYWSLTQEGRQVFKRVISGEP